MSKCLSGNEISRLLSGDLSNAEEASLDLHLRGCAICLETLNEKTPFPDSFKKALSSKTTNHNGNRDSVIDCLLGAVHSSGEINRLNSSNNQTRVISQSDTGTGDLFEARRFHQALPQNIPGYEFLEEIGCGGLGIVYKARQVALGRIVAVKMILSHALPGSSELGRFQLEAEAVAKLQHPNVVQVFDIIEYEGCPFLCMEYVPGETLSQRLDGKPQPLNTAARLVEILAHAIHEVHETGFLHRDLKPANILLAASKENGTGTWHTVVDGISVDLQPKITDFGLAKQVGTDSGLTDTQSALGTPSYMSPEQVRACKNVTQTTDIYSLGAILYEALVGRPPFRGSSAVETMAQVIHEEPVPPRKMVKTIPVDLEAVCLKCLEKEPKRRYATAEELADDLRRVQDGLPTLARPATHIERAWRVCKRHPVVSMLLVAILFSGWIIRAAFIEQQNATRAQGLVDALLSADVSQVPGIIEEIEPYRKWTDSLLHTNFEEADSSTPARLNTALAILPTDDSKVDFLSEQLHQVTPNEFPVVRQALLLHKDTVSKDLWQFVQDEQQSATHRFQAAVALATYAPDDKRWSEIAPFVIEHLTSVVHSVYFASWLEHLRPARKHLSQPLFKSLTDHSLSGKQRDAAAFALALYLHDEPDELADAILVADEYSEFNPLIDAMRVHAKQIAPRFITILQTPMPDDSSIEHRDAHWNRQSLAAVTLVELGHANEVWPFLKFRKDPSLRSMIIHHLSKLRADHKVLAFQLEAESDSSIRQALIESFGGQDEQSIPPQDRYDIIDQLQELYANDPEPGVHGSASWSLRNWGAELPTLSDSAELPTSATDAGRRWYVNSQGQTMVVFTTREGDINHSFAISTHETTLVEFLRFQKLHVNDEATAPTKDCPVHNVDWHMAASYCNWLSEQEGIAVDQWAYLVRQDTNPDMMTAKRNYLDLEGYRLPTASEWERACRAGTTTDYSFGESVVLLPRYGQFESYSSHPVESLLPNDAGLFDMHGNVWEWTHDRAGANIDYLQRAVCGGASGLLPPLLRSSSRMIIQPVKRSTYIGFRVVRSLPGFHEVE